MDGSEFAELLSSLLEVSQRAAPGELPTLVQDATRQLGLLDAAVYLADVQQLSLIPLSAETVEESMRGVGVSTPALTMDGTLAGWAYRTGSPQLTSGSSLVMWLPLVEGVERIGVLRFTAPSLDGPMLERCKALASLVARLVASKAGFSDLIMSRVRTRPMTIQAELAWAFMPPRTIGTRNVTCSAVLEPAYEIGGDAFDHSLTAHTLHVTVVDAMGHDLASGLSAAVAMAGCRSSRRAGGSLADITATVDEALNQWLPEHLLTAVFADLDLETGALTWVNCGHPPPSRGPRRPRTRGAAPARHQPPSRPPHAEHHPPRPAGTRRPHSHPHRRCHRSPIGHR
ncbi:PP2C family protein-serine/threonine phosphatase [Streptomyces sp. NPDC059385]|uniref:PP2C family protein-serine/threonine phosphatase n=1 Tax=Streptomyces sp. NPDC059385 TaxID=3346817 RepID=UPI0036C3AFE5